MANEQVKIYTVSQLTTLIKTTLENNLPGRLTVTGEISGFKIHPPSGNCYFDLKDEDAILHCVIWDDKYKALKFKPESGLAVFAMGRVSVFPRQGKYQFYVERMDPAGKGALWLAYEQTKKHLAAQGLFDESHKKPLPKYPRRIGVLTSESGAAIDDIKKSIFDRWPCVLCLYSVPVQGEGAAEKIALGVKDVNRRNDKLKLDILIVGRGGGSPEDLWAFNEEVLARAIYDSKIPVISAVGHEEDVTIADWVADVRASTPTKAGVVAVPDVQEVLSDLANKESSLDNNITLCFRYHQQELDDGENKLGRLVRDIMAGARERLNGYYEQVVRLEPHRLLGRKMAEVNELRSRANAAVSALLGRVRMQLTAQENRLEGLNPRAVLKRGYSITTLKQTGAVLKNAAQAQIGDTLVTELAENLIESRITKK